jgi:hypothetical protein
VSEIDDRERDAYEQGKVDHFTKKLRDNSGDSDGTEETCCCKNDDCCDDEFTRDRSCDCDEDNCQEHECCECCPCPPNECPTRGIGFADVLLSVKDISK